MTLKAARICHAIPDVRRWLVGIVLEVPLSYYITQALTGHGRFQKYLLCIGRADSARCYHFPGELNAADHTQC